LMRYATGWRNLGVIGNRCDGGAYRRASERRPVAIAMHSHFMYHSLVIPGQWLTLLDSVRETRRESWSVRANTYLPRLCYRLARCRCCCTMLAPPRRRAAASRSLHFAAHAPRAFSTGAPPRTSTTRRAAAAFCAWCRLAGRGMDVLTARHHLPRCGQFSAAPAFYRG